MNNHRLDELLAEIRELEAKIQGEMRRKEQQLQYEVRRRKVVFKREIAELHRIFGCCLGRCYHTS